MNIEFPIYILAIICWAAMSAGVLFHFLTKLSELEQAGVIISPGEYWKAHPYTSAVVIVAAHIMLLITWGMGELSIVGSAFIGIGCNSLGDKLRARSSMYSDRLIEKAGDKPAA